MSFDRLRLRITLVDLLIVLAGVGVILALTLPAGD